MIHPTEVGTPRDDSAVDVTDAVFRRTIAGYNESEHHHVLRRPELRRLLAMIDGEQEIDALLPYFRAAELGGLLNELLALGLIEAAARGAWQSGVAASAAPALQRSLTPMQFEAARRAAMHATAELLGGGARPFSARLIACQDSQMLREVIDELLAEVRARVGDGAATLLVESVRSATRGGD